MFTLLGEMPPNPGWEKPLLNPATGTSWMYPICILLGFVVAIVLSCLKMWKRYKISTEPFYWFILIGVPLAILGANFGSCVLGPPAGKEWSEFFSSFGSGLAIEWGVLFVVVAAFIYFPLVLKKPKYCVRNEFSQAHEVQRVSFWMYADAIMPCILIAQFIGRWGNYCNQEVYGANVTSEGLANFLNKVLPGMYIEGAWKQPLFLWEGIANLGMFFIMYFGIECLRIRKAGDMGAGYLLWYGSLRLCLEPLRDHQYYSMTSIIFSGVFVLAGLGFIIVNHMALVPNRRYKMFHYIIYKPMEKSSKKGFPKKIKKLQAKLEKIQNNPSDVAKAQKIKNELEVYQNDWNKLQEKYASQQYKDSFIRKESELVYYGRW